MPITSQLVKDFYAEACKKYKAETFNKSNSNLMDLVGKFLDVAGIVKQEEFKKRFTTTVGNHIYCPFAIGVDGGAGNYDLWDQVRVLVHELVHVGQFYDSPALFNLKYLFYTSDRATYEAQALAADLEMEWWFTGHGYDVKNRAQVMLLYGLKQEHADYVAEYLAVHDDVCRQGGNVNPIVAWATEWLTVHGAKA